MDVQMPEMDGYEATRRIRDLEAERSSASTASSEISHKRIPIIAMTANVFREDVERCLAVGMDSHIGKPLNIDEVVDALRAFLPSG